MGQLQSIEPQLSQLDYQVIATSPDRPEKVRETVEKHSPGFSLLSDSKMAAAKGLGIAFEVDEKGLKQFTELGIDLEDASGETHHQLPAPAVFVVGKDGVIKFEYVNPNHTVRLEADVLLAAARAALQ